SGERRIPKNVRPPGFDLAVVRGSCRLPRFMATPGPVKSTAQNSPGNQHKNRQINPAEQCMESLEFITAIPWDVRSGSGCYVGTRTLAEALRATGTRVEVIKPEIKTPVYGLTRLLFNESLRWHRFNSAATIGIDADGYAVPQGHNSPPHIA